MIDFVGAIVFACAGALGCLYAVKWQVAREEREAQRQRGLNALAAQLAAGKHGAYTQFNWGQGYANKAGGIRPRVRWPAQQWVRT